MTIRRYALVTSGFELSSEQVGRYLPGNYRVEGKVMARQPWGSEVPGVLVSGEDNDLFTLDEYVIPRLASGMYWAVEIEASQARLARERSVAASSSRADLE